MNSKSIISWDALNDNITNIVNECAGISRDVEEVEFHLQKYTDPEDPDILDNFIELHTDDYTKLVDRLSDVLKSLKELKKKSSDIEAFASIL